MVALALVLVVGVGGLVGRRLLSERPAENHVPQVVDHIDLPAGPGFVAVGPNGNVYVNHDGVGERSAVSIIVNRKVTGRLDGGSSIGYVAVAPDNTVYISDISDGTVQAYQNNKQVASLKLETGITYIAVDQQGTAYVPQPSGTVAVVSGLRLKSPIQVGGKPRGIVVAPDGTLYAADSAGGTVSVIKSGKVTQQISVAGSPTFMGVASDGTLYVGLDNCSLAIVKDAVVTTAIPLGSCDFTPQVAMGPGDQVYVSLASETGPGELVVVKGTSIVGRVAVGSQPSGLAVAADGTVYVAEFGDQRVAVLR